MTSWHLCDAEQSLLLWHSFLGMLGSFWMVDGSPEKNGALMVGGSLGNSASLHCCGPPVTSFDITIHAVSEHCAGFRGGKQSCELSRHCSAPLTCL